MVHGVVTMLNIDGAVYVPIRRRILRTRIDALLTTKRAGNCAGWFPM